MPSNELTLCTAGGMTLLYCVKCQHHYGSVFVKETEIVIWMQGSIRLTRTLRESIERQRGTKGQDK